MTDPGEQAPENPFAGQGAVMLDIGGDVGALVVEMPQRMLGVEIEIAPSGHGRHEHPHEHSHEHSGGLPHGHLHGQGHHPHVAVVARPTPAGPVASLVYGELREGEYDLYEKEGGPVAMTVAVRGGEVTEATWPG